MDCLGHGDPDPLVRWYQQDKFPFTEVVDSPPLIELHSNGTLTFLGFSPTISYRQDVHSAKYICSVSNRHGTITSHPVTVRALTNHQLQPAVYDEYVMMGNTAVLTCTIPSFVKDHMKIVAWIREDNLVIRPQKTGKDPC